MDAEGQTRWTLIAEAEMLRLGARRVTALEPVGSIVLLALPDGSTLKYDSKGELSSLNYLKASRYVLADNRPVAHHGMFFVGDFQPVGD